MPTNQERLLGFLREHPGEWMTRLQLERFGGQEATRRYRELRSAGFPVEDRTSRAYPGAPSHTEYRYQPRSAEGQLCPRCGMEAFEQRPTMAVNYKEVRCPTHGWIAVKLKENP